MIINGQNRIEYRSHNGRHYNIIATYDPATELFRLTTPGFAKEWAVSDEINQEVKDQFKNDKEIETFTAFVNKCTYDV